MSNSDPSNQINYTPPEDSGLYLWADCEFTGTELKDGHKIIEIGVMVTDLALREVDTHQRFIGYDWNEVERLMDLNEWWDDRADDRERMRLGTSAAPDVTVVDNELARFVEDYFGDHRPPLCGNSIGNDRKHIDDQLPQFREQMSYRVVDVTSFMIVGGTYKGLRTPEKRHLHYALDDIRESVAEFRFLMKALGITDFSQFSTDE